MKKFDFSLSKLLNYKITLLDSEKDKLNTLNHNLRLEEEKLEVTKTIYRTCIEELENKIRQGAYVSDIYIYNIHISETEKAIKQQERKISVLVSDIEYQTQIVLGLTKEKTSLVKLQDKQLCEYNKECSKEEERLIEEFISNSAMALELSLN